MQQSKSREPIKCLWLWDVASPLFLFLIFTLPSLCCHTINTPTKWGEEEEINLVDCYWFWKELILNSLARFVWSSSLSFSITIRIYLKKNTHACNGCKNRSTLKTHYWHIQLTWTPFQLCALLCWRRVQPVLWHRSRLSFVPATVHVWQSPFTSATNSVHFQRCCTATLLHSVQMDCAYKLYKLVKISSIDCTAKEKLWPTVQRK